MIENEDCESYDFFRDKIQHLMPKNQLNYNEMKSCLFFLSNYDFTLERGAAFHLIPYIVQKITKSEPTKITSKIFIQLVYIGRLLTKLIISLIKANLFQDVAFILSILKGSSHDLNMKLNNFDIHCTKEEFYVPSGFREAFRYFKYCLGGARFSYSDVLSYTLMLCLSTVECLVHSKRFDSLNKFLETMKFSYLTNNFFSDVKFDSISDSEYLELISKLALPDKNYLQGPIRYILQTRFNKVPLRPINNPGFLRKFYDVCESSDRTSTDAIVSLLPYVSATHDNIPLYLICTKKVNPLFYIQSVFCNIYYGYDKDLLAELSISEYSPNIVISANVSANLNMPCLHNLYKCIKYSKDWEHEIISVLKLKSRPVLDYVLSKLGSKDFQVVEDALQMPELREFIKNKEGISYDIVNVVHDATGLITGFNLKSLILLMFQKVNDQGKLVPSLIQHIYLLDQEHERLMLCYPESIRAAIRIGSYCSELDHIHCFHPVMNVSTIVNHRLTEVELFISHLYHTILTFTKNYSSMTINDEILTILARLSLSSLNSVDVKQILLDFLGSHFNDIITDIALKIVPTAILSSVNPKYIVQASVKYLDSEKGFATGCDIMKYMFDEDNSEALRTLVLRTHNLTKRFIAHNVYSSGFTLYLRKLTELLMASKGCMSLKDIALLLPSEKKEYFLRVISENIRLNTAGVLQIFDGLIGIKNCIQIFLDGFAKSPDQIDSNSIKIIDKCLEHIPEADDIFIRQFSNEEEDEHTNFDDDSHITQNYQPQNLISRETLLKIYLKILNIKSDTYVTHQLPTERVIPVFKENLFTLHQQNLKYQSFKFSSDDFHSSVYGYLPCIDSILICESTDIVFCNGKTLFHYNGRTNSFDEHVISIQQSLSGFIVICKNNIHLIDLNNLSTILTYKPFSMKVIAVEEISKSNLLIVTKKSIEFSETKKVRSNLSISSAVVVKKSGCWYIYTSSSSVITIWKVLPNCHILLVAEKSIKSFSNLTLSIDKNTSTLFLSGTNGLVATITLSNFDHYKSFDSIMELPPVSEHGYKYYGRVLLEIPSEQFVYFFKNKERVIAVVYNPHDVYYTKFDHVHSLSIKNNKIIFLRSNGDISTLEPYNVHIHCPTYLWKENTDARTDLPSWVLDKEEAQVLYQISCCREVIYALKFKIDADDDMEIFVNDWPCQKRSDGYYYVMLCPNALVIENTVNILLQNCNRGSITDFQFLTAASPHDIRIQYDIFVNPILTKLSRSLFNTGSPAEATTLSSLVREYHRTSSNSYWTLQCIYKSGLPGQEIFNSHISTIRKFRELNCQNEWTINSCTDFILYNVFDNISDLKSYFIKVCKDKLRLIKLSLI